MNVQINIGKNAPLDGNMNGHIDSDNRYWYSHFHKET
jgi:hypothetical protein